MQKELARDGYDWLKGLGPFAEEHGVNVIDAKPYIGEKSASGAQELRDL